MGTKMAKNFQVQLDEELQRSEEEVFARLGMDFSTGIAVYLTQVVQVDGIPFALTNHRSGLDRSLAELRAGDYASFSSVDHLLVDLNR